MGPTASGKTDLAIRLAEALDGELISVDSALVYRGMDIGSAKPDYPHHLVDICDPSEIYSASRFVIDAQRAIESVRAAGRRPILVGGTMLYYRALLEGLAPMPAADPALRAELEARAHREGWPALHNELALLDPEAAQRIHPNHSQRLVRALEICILTGKPLTQVHARGSDAESGLDSDHSPPKALAIALAPSDRSVLHRRIELRFKQMLEKGFEQEVIELYQRGDLHLELPSMRAVGYRQMWEYLEGNSTLEQAIELAVIATRQLAKRQFTWLRKWPDLLWIHTDENSRVESCDLAVSGENYDDSAELVLNYLVRNPM